WACPLAPPAPLVVAAIADIARQQTWNDLARALRAAAKLATDDGTIVLCSALDRPLGAALRELAASREAIGTLLPQETIDHLRQRKGRDAVAAVQLAETLPMARVYLLSQLAAEQVEELGMAHVTQAHEIEVLARSFSTCNVLHAA